MLRFFIWYENNEPLAKLFFNTIRRTIHFYALETKPPRPLELLQNHIIPP